jgi:hypothetical protein
MEINVTVGVAVAVSFFLFGVDRIYYYDGGVPIFFKIILCEDSGQGECEVYSQKKYQYGMHYLDYVRKREEKRMFQRSCLNNTRLSNQR